MSVNESMKSSWAERFFYIFIYMFYQLLRGRGIISVIIIINRPIFPFRSITFCYIILKLNDYFVYIYSFYDSWRADPFIIV